MKRVGRTERAGNRLQNLTIHMHHGIVAALVVQACLAINPAKAQEIELGEPALVVDRTTPDGTKVMFDATAIAGLARLEFMTSTPWTTGVHSFSGPSLLALLREARAVGKDIRLDALNGYSVEIPVDQLTETAPIVADRIDGKPFSIRDKGPLWVIYPYDSDVEFQTEVTYARSIWQLVSITVLPD